MSEVTQILERISDGDSGATDELWVQVYGELKKLAVYRLRSDGPGLKATELVHEAYIRLVDSERPQHWEGRAHFFAAAGEAMRRILIDMARKRRSQKRGGKVAHIDVDMDLVVDGQKIDELLAIDEALTRLEGHDKTAALLVKLRFFGGMKHKDAADAMNLSKRKADHIWVIARTWLHKEIAKNSPDEK